jgi:hypothetical protein
VSYIWGIGSACVHDIAPVMKKKQFWVLMEELTASNYQFFKASNNDRFLRTSSEARLLFPLKTLAYGNKGPQPRFA